MQKQIFAAALSAALLVGCGSDSDTTVNSFSIAAPAIAVTSPTAGSSTTTAAVKHSFLKKAALSVPLLGKLVQWMTGTSHAEESTDKPTDIKPFADLKKEIKNEFQLPPDQIVSKMGDLARVDTYKSPCFGPSWEDNSENPGGGFRTRPGGDLGIQFNTRDNTSAEACAAAQLNSLIGGKPHLFNKVRRLVFALLNKANAEGKSLPAVGESIDVTMPSVEGVTFTTAKLQRLEDDADGNPVYKSTIVAEKDGRPVRTILYHTPLNADNTEGKGLFQAVLPHTDGGPGRARGISLVYNQQGGVVKFVLDSSANRGSPDPDFFNANTGRVDFTKTASQEDFNRLIAQFNESTGAATAHFAWQAGAGDRASRAFAATTTGASQGATGIAYFGFGKKFNDGVSSLPDTTTTMWPENMHCNWVKPLQPPNPPAPAAIPKVQRQTMTRGAEVFEPATTNRRFAPTDNCTQAGAWEIKSAQPAFMNNATVNNTATHDLVDPGTDIPAVTVPTFTLP